MYVCVYVHLRQAFNLNKQTCNIALINTLITNAQKQRRNYTPHNSYSKDNNTFVSQNVQDFNNNQLPATSASYQTEYFVDAVKNLFFDFLSLTLLLEMKPKNA